MTMAALAEGLEAPPVEDGVPMGEVPLPPVELVPVELVPVTVGGVAVVVEFWEKTRALWRRMATVAVEKRMLMVFGFGGW